tara:strand:+ start:157 stop:396 length:240 start_codon:yes stop_codon:yes gene_type:complete
MCYTTIKVHAEQLAAVLAQRKVEKKWEALGWSPYIEGAFGCQYTENAEADYEKHYAYFMEIILSKSVLIEKEKKELNYD